MFIPTSAQNNKHRHNTNLQSTASYGLVHIGCCLDASASFFLFLPQNISEPVPYTFACVLNTFHTSPARQPTVALGFCFRVGLLDTKLLRSYPRRQKLGIL